MPFTALTGTVENRLSMEAISDRATIQYETDRLWSVDLSSAELETREKKVQINLRQPLYPCLKNAWKPDWREDLHNNVCPFLGYYGD